MKVAIYQRPDSECISILYPTDKYKDDLHACCKKCVPAGLKYKIIDISELPKDSAEFRSAWTAPSLETDYDGVGG